MGGDGGDRIVAERGAESSPAPYRVVPDPGATVDLDDLLEDLWEDAARDARERVRTARSQIARKGRMPGVRRRLRSLMLYGSAAWVAVFGSAGIGAELAFADPWDTALALLLGGIALPAVGTGLWAWRGQRKDHVLEREALAASRAKQERAELPADVVGEWVRLRRAQALVVDLAGDGLVDEQAVAETGEMIEDLRVLLIADRRASELGGAPSQPLRGQVGEVADLLVALAAEAVELRSEQVGRGAPATLVDGRDKLASLRAARAEVDAVDKGTDAAAAAAWVEAEAAAHRADEEARRRERRDDRRGDDRGRPQQG